MRLRASDPVTVMTDERALVAALRAALDPTPVFWGLAPFESANVPPSLPLVVVQRLNYATALYENMCAEPYRGDTLILIDSWTLNYEEGRTLAASVRVAADAAGDWRLQSENDLYEPAFRGWRIQGQWLQGGAPPL